MTSAPTPTRRRWSADAIVAVVLVLVACSATMAVLVTRVGRDWFPLGDEATIDLRVRDVFTNHTPLVGAYSRDFNHPGPLLFWLLAPLSWVAGGAPWATLVGGALLQGCAIAASGWLAFRRGGVLLCALVLGALALGYSSFVDGQQFLRPWNPYVAFPFFLLFLLLVWSSVTGSRRSGLGAVVVGSLLVQLHVGYVPLVLAAGAWCVLVVLVETRRGTRGHRADESRWPTALLWCGVLALLWIGPVIEQHTRDPGNIRLIVDYFRGGTGASVGLRTGAGIFAAEFKVPPPWLGGGDRLSFATLVVQPESLAWLLIPVALLTLGFFAATRSGRRGDRRLLKLATVMAVVTVVAVSRVTVDAVAFIFFWRVTTALLIVVATLWAVANWLRVDDVLLAKYVGVGALALVIALFFGARARDVVTYRDGLGPKDAQAQALLDQATRGHRPEGTVLVRGLGTTTEGLVQGVEDALDRHGIDARVDPEWGFAYGDQRTATRDEVDEVWYVSPFGQYRSLLDPDSGARVVGYSSALPSDVDSDLVARQCRVAAQLEAAGRSDLVDYIDSPFFAVVVQRENVPGVDLDDARRIAAVNDQLARTGGCRCAIIGYPADRAPDLPYSMGF
jgi:hypothetical protein